MTDIEELGADERADLLPACRVYRTDEATSGSPDWRWVDAALDPAG